MTDPVSKLSITPLSVERARDRRPGPRDQRPPAPGNLRRPRRRGNVTLTWAPATTTSRSPATRSRRDGTLLTTTGAGATTWTDRRAGGGTTYSYAVAAHRRLGATSAPDGHAPGRRPAAGPDAHPDADRRPRRRPPRPTDARIPPSRRPNDIQAPTAPDRPDRRRRPRRPSTLAWEPASDDTGVVGYRVTRNGNLVASPADVTWKDTARRPLHDLHLHGRGARRRRQRQRGVDAITVGRSPDTAAPTRPTDFHKVARRGARVTFDWDPSTDNVGIGGTRSTASAALAGGDDDRLADPDPDDARRPLLRPRDRRAGNRSDPHGGVRRRGPARRSG